MIKVKDLKKAFGQKIAVNGVTFTVEKGEVLGFLGPNGAGKSTTMRMVTGYFPPTAGSVEVCGVNMLEQPERAKTQLGYLPENAPLYSDMSVAGFLGFAAELRGIYGAAKHKAIDKALETCFLESVRNQSVDTLSKGFRHRTCLAQSIIHDPEVLILDEPTDGLDPNQKHEVRNLIKRMGEKKAIVFSTHILEEVEAVCSRAIIIDRGEIVADGTPNALKLKAPDAQAIQLLLLQAKKEEVSEALGRLAGIEKLQFLSQNEPRVEVRISLKKEKSNQSENLLREISDLANAKGWKLIELHRQDGTLDEMFRSLTRSEVAKS